MKVQLNPKAGCIPDATVFLGDSPPSASYTAKASAALNRPVAVRKCLSPGSSTDFIRAVRMLAAALTANGFPSEPPQREVQKIWKTFVCCPLELWEKIFGERNAEMQIERQRICWPFCVWEYQCSDGLVRCIVYLLDHPEGPRILVVRVCCP